VSCENCADAYDEGYTAGHNAENARLRGDLDTALGLRRMESRRVDTVRDQAEALAAALETVLYYAETYTVARFERGKVAGARATLRAYREGGCPGCSFRRQTGGNHDDVPTGDADPNCAYREATP